MKTYAYMVAAGDGRVERLDCGFLTLSTLYLWAEHGHLPEAGGWWKADSRGRRKTKTQ